MTREIKFRAWDGEKMVCPDWLALHGKTVCASWKENSVIEQSNTIMQYTGLKDRNGKEIWEGDIIRNERGDWGVIVYKAPAFEVTVSEDQSSLYTKEWIEACEVIGNIYENQDDKNKNRS